MRILVTGATGFIGKAFCETAVHRDHELLALTRQGGHALPRACASVAGSLHDPPWSDIEKFEPDVVLHAAWIATPGEYLMTSENDTLALHSNSFFRGLATIGVPHLAGLGTCIEYAASSKPLREDSSRIAPTFPYSLSKSAVADGLSGLAKQFPVATSWFRIFFPYGPGEHASRLPSHSIDCLARRQPLELAHPLSVRDYIYVTDVASALCRALEAGLTGAVNVGSGSGTRVRDLAMQIAGLLDADPSLIRDAEQGVVDPMPTIIADNARIRSTGWEPRVELGDGLQRLVSSFSQRR